jgi:hypothetical protein
MYTRGLAGGHLGAGSLVHLETRADPVGQDVGHHEADIVPGFGVVGPGVTEPNHQ